MTGYSPNRYRASHCRAPEDSYPRLIHHLGDLRSPGKISGGAVEGNASGARIGMGKFAICSAGES